MYPLKALKLMTFIRLIYDQLNILVHLLNQSIDRLYSIVKIKCGNIERV